jgi:hypothetical protein
MHPSSDGSGRAAVYVAFGRATCYMNGAWIDVHGTGAQRSDPKSGNPADYPTGRGPQNDGIRIYNYVRLVCDSGPSTTTTVSSTTTTTGVTNTQTRTVLSSATVSTTMSAVAISVTTVILLARVILRTDGAHTHRQIVCSFGIQLKHRESRNPLALSARIKCQLRGNRLIN